MDAELCSDAQLALAMMDKHPASQKELLAGALRMDAREQRRREQVRADMDVVERAAFTRYEPGSEAAA